MIGSANSSNTRALEKLAIEAGCPRCSASTTSSELPDDLTGVVGVTAGASAPEDLVDAVIAAPRPAPTASRRSAATDEDEYFPPPRNIRDLQAAIEPCRDGAARRHRSDRPAIDDRSRPGERRSGGVAPDRAGGVAGCQACSPPRPQPSA